MNRPDHRPPASTAAKATPREWWGLAVIALPCLVYAMDLTVLNLAVPPGRPREFVDERLVHERDRQNRTNPNHEI